jgi:hypothetical protein
MAQSPRRTAWIVAPPEVCCLCKEPLTRAAETSAWNGSPAHRDCVRVHLIQRDPAFREWEREDPSDEAPETFEEVLPREDEDEDSG